MKNKRENPAITETLKNHYRNRAQKQIDETYTEDELIGIKKLSPQRERELKQLRKIAKDGTRD